MAPLVPDIISNEFNFVIAILIGIAFGFILEQAGFSSSKKLVGLFYGYDFTVLRVFFTAGITAMFGVILLGHFGLLDINIIYINPTYLWSAIVGGLIMGLGFVIGGFCPGTSVCAASIGKKDAMIFIIGLIIGSFVFSEMYPVLEGLYKAEFWGNVRIFESLGVSQGLVAFLFIFIAVLAFIITTLIEKRVNGELNPEFKNTKFYYSLAVVVIIIGLFSFALPEKNSVILKNAENPEVISKTNFNVMSSDELAYRLMEDENSIQIFDLRSKEEFEKFSLPGAINITTDFLLGKDGYKLLSLKSKKNIFISDNEKDEKKAAYIAMDLGYKKIFILEGGIQEFQKNILDYKKPTSFANKREEDVAKFREIASRKIPILIEKSKSKKGEQPTKTKRVLGGC